jgi:hypothetical protein
VEIGANDILLSELVSIGKKEREKGGGGPLFGSKQIPSLVAQKSCQYVVCAKGMVCTH